MSHAENVTSLQGCSGIFVTISESLGETFVYPNTRVHLSHLDPVVYQSTATFFLPDNCSGSNLSDGSLLHRSNYEILATIATELGLPLVHTYGDHGSFGLLVPLCHGKIPEELVDAIRAMEAGDALDDANYIGLVDAAKKEAWENWAREEFRDALIKIYPASSEILEEMEDHVIDQLFMDELFNIQKDWYECPGGMTVNVGDVADNVSEERLQHEI